MTWLSPAEKTGQPRKPMKEILHIFQDRLKPVEFYKPDKILDRCKYVRLARRHHYTNYRLLFYKDIKPWGLLGSFSTFQAQFFADSGATLGMFNELNGNIISIIWRATNDREFMNYGLVYTLYGYDLMSPDFKYGQPIILTEGMYDADVIRQIYPNVLATLTSSVSVNMSKVLKFLSNRFIIAYDADRAGTQGFEKACNRLGVNGDFKNIKRLPIYPGDKDIGVMEEKLDSSQQEFDIRYKFYKEKLDELFDDFNNKNSLETYYL